MEVGDIVVCIDTLYVTDEGIRFEDTLILGKKYEVLDNYKNDRRRRRSKGCILVLNEYNIKYFYPKKNFRLLSDFRDDKINNLLE